jgi:ribosomal protein S27AE
MNKTQNVLVQVTRINRETREIEKKIIHADECVLKDKITAKCPKCGERVFLMLEGDRHYEHKVIQVKDCSLKTKI